MKKRNKLLLISLIVIIVLSIIILLFTNGKIINIKQAKVKNVNAGEPSSAASTATSSTLVNVVKPSDYGKSINYSVTVKETTLNDWKVLYNDGSHVYIVLSDYLPATLLPSITGVLNDGQYNVWADKNGTTLEKGLTTTSYWADFAKGASGATATGSPTVDMIINSYNAKYGKNYKAEYNTDVKFYGSDGTTLDSLYVPRTDVWNSCYGYLLASKYSGDSQCVWVMRYTGNLLYDFYGYPVRVVVSLPTNFQGYVRNDDVLIGTAYSLTINPNSGTFNGNTSNSTVVLKNGEKQTIANPTRTGYTFGGWTVSGTGSSMSGTTFTMGSANATLTAKWTINNYSLTINPNGGTFEDKTTNVTQNIDFSGTRALPNPTKAGWTFNGWAINGGTGCSINNNIFTMGTENTVLVAQWRKVDPNSWSTSKVTKYTDFTGGTAPIPVGYTASNATKENIVGSGLVIYEGVEEVNDSNVASMQKTRNQWVWVQVPDISRIYEEVNETLKSKLYNYTNTGRTAYTNNEFEPGIISSDVESNFARYELQGLTREKFTYDLQIEFNKTIESIKTYGGFYIGRYETGDLSQKVPVLRKMNTDISNTTWYSAYDKFDYLGANSNVKTNIIWGNLYDETLQWLVDTGNKTASEICGNSISWGNYKSSSFSYINTSGANTNKASGTGTIIPTGSSEYTKANNIYDLAGNIWDATLEGNGTYRRNRGGSYTDTDSICGTKGIMSPGTTEDTYGKSAVRGYRAYLYIK